MWCSKLLKTHPDVNIRKWKLILPYNLIFSLLFIFWSQTHIFVSVTVSVITVQDCRFYLYSKQHSWAGPGLFIKTYNPRVYSVLAPNTHALGAAGNWDGVEHRLTAVADLCVLTACSDALSWPSVGVAGCGTWPWWAAAAAGSGSHPLHPLPQHVRISATTETGSGVTSTQPRAHTQSQHTLRGAHTFQHSSVLAGCSVGRHLGEVGETVPVTWRLFLPEPSGETCRDTQWCIRCMGVWCLDWRDQYRLITQLLISPQVNKDIHTLI